MEKIETTELEKLLTVEPEVICSLEQHEPFEPGKDPAWIRATTITTTMTTTTQG